MNKTVKIIIGIVIFVGVTSVLAGAIKETVATSEGISQEAQVQEEKVEQPIPEVSGEPTGEPTAEPTQEPEQEEKVEQPTPEVSSEPTGEPTEEPIEVPEQEEEVEQPTPKVSGEPTAEPTEETEQEEEVEQPIPEVSDEPTEVTIITIESIIEESEFNNLFTEDKPIEAVMETVNGELQVQLTLVHNKVGLDKEMQVVCIEKDGYLENLTDILVLFLENAERTDGILDVNQHNQIILRQIFWDMIEISYSLDEANKCVVNISTMSIDHIGKEYGLNEIQINEIKEKYTMEACVAVIELLSSNEKIQSMSDIIQCATN